MRRNGELDRRINDAHERIGQIEFHVALCCRLPATTERQKQHGKAESPPKRSFHKHIRFGQMYEKSRPPQNGDRPFNNHTPYCNTTE